MTKFNWKNSIKLLIEGILGGLMIAIGMMVLLNAPNKVVGAILFAVGLLTINKFGLGLYTGKIGFVRNGYQLVVALFTLIANTIGCLVMLAYPTNGAIASLHAKMAFSHWELFLKGVVCGILIYICVANKEKPLYTIFAVPAFILCGAEHSIADIALCFAAKDFSFDSFVFIIIIALGNAVGSLLISLLLQLRDKLSQPKEDQK